jgi:hypothetical protein
VNTCDVCGRFVCALCDINLNRRHLCPGCLEPDPSRPGGNALETRRVCYDQVALLVATLPILMVWITLVTAPVALYLCVRHWRAPGSLLPRSRIRFGAACVIALLQVAVWLAVFGVV